MSLTSHEVIELFFVGWRKSLLHWMKAGEQIAFHTLVEARHAVPLPQTPDHRMHVRKASICAKMTTNTAKVSRLG
jgi:hypothetical protein